MKLKLLTLLLIILVALVSGCSTSSSISKLNPTKANTTSINKNPNFVNVVYGEKYYAVVTKVVDGDTIYVRFLSGFKGVQKIRLLGIDTPEINGKYYSRFVGDRSHVAKWAYLAKRFTSQLTGKTVQIQFDKEAGLRGKYGRLLAYVYFNGVDFNALLLKKGYARVYPSSFSKKEEYVKYEEYARNNAIGIWNLNTTKNTTKKNLSNSDIKIVYIRYNPPGNDNINLNGEYVTIKNVGHTDVNLSGWELRDKAYHVYIFPKYILHPGKTVRVHTGYGKDNATDLFWCMHSAVWNNNGDVAYLYTPSGVVENVYKYN